MRSWCSLWLVSCGTVQMWDMRVVDKDEGLQFNARMGCTWPESMCCNQMVGGAQWVGPRQDGWPMMWVSQVPVYVCNKNDRTQTGHCLVGNVANMSSFVMMTCYLLPFFC